MTNWTKIYKENQAGGILIGSLSFHGWVIINLVLPGVSGLDYKKQPKNNGFVFCSKSLFRLTGRRICDIEKISDPIPMLLFTTLKRTKT